MFFEVLCAVLFEVVCEGLVEVVFEGSVRYHVRCFFEVVFVVLCVCFRFNVSFEVFLRV